MALAALVTSIFALGISIATPIKGLILEPAAAVEGTPSSNSIEESFEDMVPGSSFEAGRQGWTAPNPGDGSANAVAIGSTMMGRLETTSTSNYKMIYGFASATSYAPGVNIEFDMSTGETNKLRSAYILTSTTAGGYDPPSDYWFISFNYDGYIIAQNGDLADVRLQPYVANVIYHVTVEFIGNMHTLDVTINGTKYTNAGAHFNTRFSRATCIGAFQVHCRASGAGWIAIDNLDASWITPQDTSPVFTFISIVVIAGVTLASAVAVLAYRKRLEATRNQMFRGSAGMSTSRSNPSSRMASTTSKRDRLLEQREPGSQATTRVPTLAATGMTRVSCPRCGNVYSACASEDTCCSFCGERFSV